MGMVRPAQVRVAVTMPTQPPASCEAHQATPGEKARRGLKVATGDSFTLQTSLEGGFKAVALYLTNPPGHAARAGALVPRSAAITPARAAPGFVLLQHQAPPRRTPGLDRADLLRDVTATRHVPKPPPSLRSLSRSQTPSLPIRLRPGGTWRAALGASLIFFGPSMW